MITLSHPKAPTISYEADICSAVMAYAKNHLPGYHVHAIADTSSAIGISFEVIDMDSSTALDCITIH